MEYEPGCENIHFRESTWRERTGLTFKNFMDQWAFAIGPILVMTGVAIVLLALTGTFK